MRSRTRLTPRVVASVRATERDPQPQMWDDAIRGLFVRGGKRGNIYALEKMVKGNMFRETIGRADELTVDEARDKAREFIRGWEKQAEHVSRIPTLARAVEEHLKASAIEGNSADRFRYSFEKYLAPLAQRAVNRIREAEVLERWEALADTPGSRQLAFANLRAVMNRFAKRYRFVSPVDVIADEIGQGKKTPLIAEWQGPTGAACWSRAVHLARSYPGQDIAVLYELVAFTGSRPEEWLPVRWSDVDLEHGYATFTAHKTAKRVGARIFPLSPHVVSLLKQHREHTTGDYLFPSREGGKLPHLASSPMRRLLEVIEEKEGYRTTAKQLRKFWITQAEIAGLTASQIDYLVGQTQGGVRAHYSFRTSDDMRPALEQVTQRLLGLIRPGSAAK